MNRSGALQACVALPEALVAGRTARADATLERVVGSPRVVVRHPLKTP